MANHGGVQEAEAKWFSILLPKETGAENLSHCSTSISSAALGVQCRKLAHYCGALPCAPVFGSVQCSFLRFTLRNTA